MMRNIVYIFLGRGVPLILGLFTIPILVHGLGSERYGMLNLICLILGYFGLFDLGLGRATTKFVAEYVERQEEKLLSELVWTAWGLLLLFGTVGGVLLVSLAPLLIEKILHVPSYLIPEATTSLYILGCAVPIMLLSAGTRGVLEGKGLFTIATKVQMPFIILDLIIPLGILQFTNSLVPIIGFMFISRILLVSVYLYLCLYHSLPSLRKYYCMRRVHMKSLFGFGGWLTLSNCISPIMEYMDRFLIGSLLGLSDVTYYVVPYTIVTKLYLIPTSVMTVLFPTFTGNFRSKEILVPLYRRAVKYIFLAMAPCVSILIIFAHDIMSVWINEAFAVKSSGVFVCFSVGLLVSSLAQVPYSLIQAAGRPDLTAKLHASEVIPYLALVYLLLSHYGIVGVAFAWTVRVTVDALLLFWCSDRVLAVGKKSLRVVTVGIPSFVSVNIALLLGTNLLFGFTGRVIVVVVALTISGILVWKFWLDSGEKGFLKCLGR